MENEIWKDIDGFNYQISNYGNIKSKNSIENIPLKELSGYKYIYLCGNKISYIHRLVAEAFIPNDEGKPCVNHIDGNKQNNRFDNLEWVTYSENNSHAYKSGLKRPNQRTKKHQSVQMVDETGEVICIFPKMKYADKLFGKRISANIVRSIKSGIKANGYFWKLLNDESEGVKHENKN